MISKWDFTCPRAFLRVGMRVLKHRITYVGTYYNLVLCHLLSTGILTQVSNDFYSAVYYNMKIVWA